MANKLRRYTWKGINHQGLRVKGELFCCSFNDMKIELLNQGIALIHVKKNFSVTLFEKKILKKDIALFAYHLSTLLSTGISLIKAIEIIANSQNKIQTQQLFYLVNKEILSGKTFHESLLKYQSFFSPLIIEYIKAGELSGTLEIMLQRLADYLDKTEQLKNLVKKNLYYPLTVISLTLVVGCLLLIFIVPQFEQHFFSFGACLPFFTRLIIHISQIIKTQGFFILLSAGLLLAFLNYFFKASKKFRHFVDGYYLKIPIIGTLIKKMIFIRICRTLSTTLAGGISMLDSLKIVSTLTNNTLYYYTIAKISALVASGQMVHDAMKKTHHFPNYMIQMIKIGEESGTLPIMLEKVARLFEVEVENFANRLDQLLEPLLILILGVMVGSFVLAMYLPIFKLGAIF